MNNPSSQSHDCIVIGAGIAGASVAYELASRGVRLLVLEAESQPGYHSTGRSAAFFAETYGNETIRALTRSSLDFFESPPEGFTDYPLLRDSGSLFIANESQIGAITEMFDRVKVLSQQVSLEDERFATARVPSLKPGYVNQCLWDPAASEVDVAALLHGYLKLAKTQGAELVCSARVEALTFLHGEWIVNTSAGTYHGTAVVNAGGSWADKIAQLAGAQPVGLLPKKRTACIVPGQGAIDIESWPLVIDVDEQFYFKPDGGNLLLSPADETLVEPMDAYSETLDVAIAIDRVGPVLDMEISRVTHEWAGLRSFVADESPVVGFDRDVEKFFWLAGQGGYGIQTAPALAQLAAGMIQGQCIPERLLELGFRPDAVEPARYQ